MPHHLRFHKEPTVKPRRPVKKRPPPISPPEDLNLFYAKTKRVITSFREATADEVQGYDPRRLVKLTVSELLSVDALNEIDGLEFVDEDDDGVIVALASEEALASFEEKLSAIMSNEKVKGQDVVYALKDMNNWGVEDRKGPRLKTDPLPSGAFLVDVELWSLDGNAVELRKMRSAFEAWLVTKDISVADKLIILPYYRLEVSSSGLEGLLKHRDVRRVDLLPRYGVEPCSIFTDIMNINQVPSPEPNAGHLAVLDTGIVSNHPLLGPAVGDVQSYIDGSDPEDVAGHGTRVAGIALYGDVKSAIEAKTFIPKLWLLSGKVLSDNNTYDRKIILNLVQKAVEELKEQYGCKVFNLSFGDKKYPFNGGRLQAFAVGLDKLARSHDVLFVVSAGNFDIDDFADEKNLSVSSAYPSCLLKEEARVIDPGTAVNVVTVGSIAEHDRPFNHKTNQINKAPIASRFHPSPFTRAGNSIRSITKPDFVDFGGNYGVVVNQGTLDKNEFGQITLKHDFVDSGRLFALANGTSFAAPKVSHLAARLHGALPDIKAATLRAILAAHSQYPLSSDELAELARNSGEENINEMLRRLYGYGQINDEWLFASGEEDTTIYAEDAIGDDENHFYEIPITEDFVKGNKRHRQYTIALAYSPAVRVSRLDYTSSRISFRVKYASDLLEMADVFSNKHNIVKMNEDCIGTALSQMGPKVRDRGTLQVSSFAFQGNPRKIGGKRLFLAVTRNDRPWAKEEVLQKEPYSLAIRFQDRESTEASLYSSIQGLLQARMEVRSRGRVQE